MSIRVKYSIDVGLSENTTGLKELGGTGASPWTGTNDQMDDGGTFIRNFAGGSVDTLVDLNGLTAGRLIIIKTSQTITFKKNSSAGESSTIRALGVGSTDGVMVWTCDEVTSLYISVPGSTAAKVTFGFAGTI